MVKIEYKGRTFKSWKSYAKALENSKSKQVKCPKCGRLGTKLLQKNSCGKPNCSKCKDGPSHGPYFYVVHRVGKKVKRCYIGKNWPSSEMKNEPDQWHKIKKFLMNKLEDFGCPDSMVEPTAEKMTDKIKMILEEEV